MGNEVEGDEGVHPHVDPGAEDHRPQEEGQGAPPVLAAVPRLNLHRPAMGGLPGPDGAVDGGQQGDHHRPQDPVPEDGGQEPEAQKEGGDGRAEAEADVAPHLEDAHGRPPPVATEEVGRLRAFGVVGGRADRLQGDGGHQDPEVLHQKGDREGGGGEGQPADEEPAGPDPVAQDADGGLEDGRRHRPDEEEHPRGRVGKPVQLLPVGQEDGDGSRHHVEGQVAEADHEENLSCQRHRSYRRFPLLEV